MRKNQKPIIPNEPWYPAALKLIIRVAGADDRPCFPDAPPGRTKRRCFPAPPGRNERGCWPGNTSR
jgi:hypothetical protein